MGVQAPRNYAMLTVSIIVVGVLVSASLYATLGQPERTVTRTSTSTSIELTTESLTTTIASSSTTTSTLFVTMTFLQTIVSTTTDTATETQTSTTTDTVVNTIPWYGLAYLGSLPGCSVSYGSTSYPGACFSPKSDPVLFNCAAAAASSQGCTQQITITGSSKLNFTITVWYPYTNYNGEQPWQNCKYVEPLPTPPGPDGPYYAYCISVNSTAFLVALPALGPS